MKNSEQRIVDEFNARYEVGTPVRYWPVPVEEGVLSKTRSTAWLLFGTAVVMIAGKSGAVALSHVEVNPPRDAMFAECERLKALISAALALTDTGTDEFKKAFPPRSCGAAMAPSESVPGWRVVGRIREVLLAGGDL